MKIALASDHRGFDAKKRLFPHLKRWGHEVIDFGCESSASCDYVDFAAPAARSVAKGENEVAILLEGSGIGMSITANKVHGVRCALCWNEESARLSRQHNDANVLSIGERMIPEDFALKIVRIWLDTAFDGGRHEKRVAMLNAM